MQLRVVLMEPEFQQNIGMIARAMSNFGFSELFLVNPVNYGLEAKMHSKHSRVLENAKVVSSLKKATRGCDLVVGTSGILKRHRQAVRSPLSIGDFANKIAGFNGKIALLFGREGVGLTFEELKRCDFIVTIPTNPESPVLNVTNAAALFFFVLANKKGTNTEKPASKIQLEALEKLFSKAVDKLPGMHNPEKVKLAFKRVLNKSFCSEIEAMALLGAMRKIGK